MGHIDNIRGDPIIAIPFGTISKKRIEGEAYQENESNDHTDSKELAVSLERAADFVIGKSGI